LAPGYAVGQNSPRLQEDRAACNRMGASSEYKRSRERVGAQEDHLKDLLVRGLSGDGAAYHAFLKALSAFLRAFLRGRLARVPDEVEDLVQETLLAVHNQRHTYDASQPLTAWVHAIARYKMIDFLRRRAGREAMNEPLGDDDDLLAASDEEAREAKRDLATLLARLPDRHRLPIVHVKIEGLSVAEAAKATGMSESAVKVGIHRGLKALAALIRE
jgi:RNA polymerase sigma-70 factor (ECF subfamily)